MQKSATAVQDRRHDERRSKVPFGIRYMTPIKEVVASGNSTNTKCITGTPGNNSTDTDDT